MRKGRTVPSLVLGDEVLLSEKSTGHYSCNFKKDIESKRNVSLGAPDSHIPAALVVTTASDNFIVCFVLITLINKTDYDNLFFLTLSFHLQSGKVEVNWRWRNSIPFVAKMCRTQLSRRTRQSFERRKVWLPQGRADVSDSEIQCPGSRVESDSTAGAELGGKGEEMPGNLTRGEASIGSVLRR